MFYVHVCTYILPLRRPKSSEPEAREFAEYFRSVSAAGCEVLVVDGSACDVFAAHGKIWTAVCRHEAVDPRFKNLNDKVNGVQTGIALASNEKIILADDDIRYTKIDIERMYALLDEFEVVRPQNYLRWIGRSADDDKSNAPLALELTSNRGLLDPPWALTESARMLINRATLRTADYPGTCGFRRQTFLNAGEYDGDVLFDNEELIRHFARCRARIVYANDFFILKRAPTFRKWLEQRPRQAYEDFPLRFKSALFAALLPITFVLAFLNRHWLSIFVFAATLSSIALALAGWLRGSARKYFPVSACLLAPLWIFERSVSTYWAFYWLLARGGYPFGKRLLNKGVGRDWFEGGRIAAKMAGRH